MRTFRLLSTSFALLAVSCGATPKVVTKIVTPEPCHVAAFPAFPDVKPVEFDDPDSGQPVAVVFPTPDFTALAEWVSEVAEWKAQVEACPQVKTTPPKPPGVGSTTKALTWAQPTLDEVFIYWNGSHFRMV